MEIKTTEELQITRIDWKSIKKTFRYKKWVALDDLIQAKNKDGFDLIAELDDIEASLNKRNHNDKG